MQENTFSTPESAEHYHNVMGELLTAKGFKLNPENPVFLFLQGTAQVVLDADQMWYPIPSAEEMRELSVHIDSLIGEINEARLHGWLKAAIDAAE